MQKYNVTTNGLTSVATDEKTSTHYVVEADCLDENKQEATRRLDNVRGMSDNGQPGWSRFGAIQFPDYASAKEATLHPYSYSVNDGHYTGGDIRIIKVYTESKVVITTEVMESIKYEKLT